MSRASRPAHSQCSAIGQNCRCRLVFEFSYFLYYIFHFLDILLNPYIILSALYRFIFNVILLLLHIVTVLSNVQNVQNMLKSQRYVPRSVQFPYNIYTKHNMMGEK